MIGSGKELWSRHVAIQYLGTREGRGGDRKGYSEGVTGGVWLKLRIFDVPGQKEERVETGND